MDDTTRNALRALFGVGADGGFLAAPPGLDGAVGLGLPAITGLPRPRGEWDVAVSARAPLLIADESTFVALEDGTLVTADDVVDGALVPLADAVEQLIAPPYRAGAVRREGDVWGVAARRTRVLELAAGIPGEVLEASRVGGLVEVHVDGVAIPVPPAVRDLLDAQDGDVAVTGDRFDRTLWAVDVWPL